MGMRMSKPARVRAGMADGAHSHEPPSPLWMCAELGLASSSLPLPSAISLSVGPLSPHFVVSLVRFVSSLSG